MCKSVHGGNPYLKATEKRWIFIYDGSAGKLCFAQKCILGDWLYNFIKVVGRVYSASKSSVRCSKVCWNDRPIWSVQSGQMVTECGVKPLSAIICLMKWGALQFPSLSSNILQCWFIIFQTYRANILNTWYLQTFLWM